jgi:hypothetical protein
VAVVTMSSVWAYLWNTWGMDISNVVHPAEEVTIHLPSRRGNSLLMFTVCFIFQFSHLILLLGC